MNLDICCSLRNMWRVKDDYTFIYADKAKEVEPDIVADWQHSPFKEGAFHNVYWDPPFSAKVSSFRKYWTGGKVYYGVDISNAQLLHILLNGSKEIHRILHDEGLLHLKWQDYEKPLWKVLALLKEWTPIMIEKVRSTMQRGEAQTFWVTLTKSETIKNAPTVSNISTSVIGGYQGSGGWAQGRIIPERDLNGTYF